MAQQIVLKLAGLYTNPNQLSTVPDGAMTQAKNIRLNTDNLAECRRGVDVLTGVFSTGSDRADVYTIYQNKLLAHHGNSTLSYYNSTVWTDYSGTFNSPDSPLFRLKFLTANSNLYFTTSSGVQKLDAFNATPALAGVPQGLDISAMLTTPGAGEWFLDQNQVAYEIVWAITDANGNVNRGAPSQRFVVINNSGMTVAVQLTFSVPAGITTNHFYEIYRTAMSGGVAIPPGEEYQLVYTAPYTSGTTVTVTDVTDDTLRGASLYTDPSVETALQANYRPPYCKDLDTFRNVTFYANTKLPQQLNLNLLAVGAPSGVQIGDVLTIAGVTYTGAASENVAAREFAVVTTGTPAQNIADTAQSLVRVINRSASTTLIYAYYISSANDLPGKILLQARTPGASSFTAQASTNGGAWSPSLATTQTSTQTVNLNGLYFSKISQPEAVPLVNVLFVGAASKQILRIIALRDSLFILKEDGVYRLSGADPTSFTVQLFDVNTILLAPETARSLSNFVFALTDQGVVKISDTGVSIISRPIEDQILNIFGYNLDQVKQLSHAVAYNTNRTYHLWTLNTAGGVQPGRCFVYNNVTNTWTEDDFIKSAAFVGTFEGNGGTVVNDRLILGDSSSPKTNFERKAFNNTDFVDEGFAVNIVSFTGEDVTLTSSSGVQVGDLLWQSAAINAVITAITGNVVTVGLISPWTAGAATVFTGIPVNLQWVPISAGNPGALKHWRDGALLFKERRFVLANLQFQSDIVNQTKQVDVSGVFGYGWGLFPWGGLPWGGAVPLPIPIRFYVPKEQARNSQLTVTYNQRSAYSVLRFEGISLWFNLHKEKVRR